MVAKKKTISIKPANKGKLRAATGTKQGATIPAATLQKLAKSKNPTTRKRAQFALNAKKFKH